MRMIGMPKNFIGTRPGRVYSWGDSASIQTASGTVVTFPQSEERAFSGLSIYGHSTQDGTPSPDNPVPIVSAGDSGEINVTVGGAQLIQSENPISDRDIVVGDLQAGTYTLSFLSNSDWWTDNSNKRSLFLENGDADITIVMQNTVVGERCYGTFTIEEPMADVIIRTYDNNTVSVISEIMLNIGSTALPYEPYKTPQTLTLSTPGGLPGIPVNSGGNYTDESGQQWICDEIDLKRGKYVQRVGKVELDGTEAFELVQGIESGQPFFLLRNSINSGQSTLNGYSNYFPIVSITIRGKEQGIGGWGTDLYLRWTELFSAVEDLKSFLSEKYTSGNPVRVSYILTTPIETDLPAEEIAAYKALHTYSPTTTVSNDANAWMKVEYKG